jgi:tetratricopeptide (TPR) repeat protein
MRKTINTQPLASPVIANESEPELFEGPYDHLEQSWAIDECEKDYKSVVRYTQKAAAYFSLKMPTEALAELDQAPPELHENHRLLGLKFRIYTSMRRSEECREALNRYAASIRRAIELKGEEACGVECHFNQHLLVLGWTLEKESGLETALPVFEKGVEILPNSGITWFQLARILHLLLQPERARSALSTCVEVDPILCAMTLCAPKYDQLMSLIMDRKPPLREIEED